MKQKRLAALRTQAASIPPGLIAVNAKEDYNYGITNARVRLTYFKVHSRNRFNTGKRKLPYQDYFSV